MEHKEKKSKVNKYVLVKLQVEKKNNSTRNRMMGIKYKLFDIYIILYIYIYIHTLHVKNFI